MKDIKPISLIFLIFSFAKAIGASEIPPPEGYLAISATLVLTNNASQEPASIGATNFSALVPLLSAYANLAGRTILVPTNFTTPAINLWIGKPLQRQAALQAFDTILGLNGIALISLGEKWIKADHFSDGCQITRPIEDKSVEPFVTHVLQLKHTLPSEVSSVLKPFAKANPEFIVALDHSHILVIRDYPENVKRMLDMIAVIDVPPTQVKATANDRTAGPR
jgi:type II secretory pathway component GspD/PulD (secretin)